MDGLSSKAMLKLSFFNSEIEEKMYIEQLTDFEMKIQDKLYFVAYWIRHFMDLNKMHACDINDSDSDWRS
jgi:hypothetical protein